VIAVLFQIVACGWHAGMQDVPQLGYIGYIKDGHAMPCIDTPFYGPRGHHIENFHRKDRCTSIQMSCSKPHMVESGLSAILGFTLDIDTVLNCGWTNHHGHMSTAEQAHLSDLWVAGRHKSHA